MAKRADFRAVQGVPSTVIDGDFVQYFLDLQRTKQLDVCKRMLNQQLKGDDAFCSLMCVLLGRLKLIH
jgi:hypothetical protein